MPPPLRVAPLLLAFSLAGCGMRYVPPSGTPQPAHARRYASRPPRLLGRPVGYAAPQLAIPVSGITPDELRDSFDEARSGGRTHHAIDILAPRGTPVLAAADGTVLKLSQSRLGGICLYVLGSDGYTVYYYAHLDGYAAGLAAGHPVRAGQIMAYVGDTGNAGPGNYHLHFSVSRIADPERWWAGENLNPFPLLTGRSTGDGVLRGGG